MTSSTLPLRNIDSEENAPAMATEPYAEEAQREPGFDMPAMRVTKKKAMPSGVASNVKQHVILTRDCSSSMAGDKIRELNAASDALLFELSQPINKGGFFISVVDFDSGGSIRMTAQPAAEARMPQASAGGGTNFDAAILKSIDVIDGFARQPQAAGYHYLRPYVLFLSDGHSNVSDRNIASLHERAGVGAVAYGADADQTTLSRIASDGEVQVIGTRGGELRGLLAAVGQTLSETLRK